MTDPNEDHLSSHHDYNVLFLCQDNACCSIMAEALLRRWGRGDFTAFSAGTKPSSAVHPQVVGVLETQRVWQPNLAPKSCEQFLKADAPRMDFVISLGETPPAELPSGWPGGVKPIHWRITEPLHNAKPEHIEQAFRRAFLELENRIKLFVLVYQREALRRKAA
jgi:arsenate reductase